MLYTNLKHIENTAAWQTVLSRHRDVVIVCGRMDPDSVRLYRIAESLERAYRSVHFFDMEYNHPNLQAFYQSVNPGSSVPFILIYHNGDLKQVLRVVTTADQLKDVLDREFKSKISYGLMMKDRLNREVNLINNQK